MVAKHETPATPESADAPARYWPGYDTLLDEIARVNAQLAKRDGKNTRDSWWRFKTRNKVLAPLETAERYRRAGTHALILNRRPYGSETEEHHCSCGLIVDMPERPDLLTAELLDERDTIFLTAPGHIDWRMRDPEHYPAREPVPTTSKPPKPPDYWKGHDTVESDLAKIRELLNLSRKGKHRDGWWRFYAITKIEGPLERVLLARERGEHYPFKTRWVSRHPRGQRLCTCGLIVPARDTPKHALSPGSSVSVLDPCWPDDPAQRAQVETTFLNAPGHLNISSRCSRGSGEMQIANELNSFDLKSRQYSSTKASTNTRALT